MLICYVNNKESWREKIISTWLPHKGDIIIHSCIKYMVDKVETDKINKFVYLNEIRPNE